jgi:dimethylamine monooxygenase subunit A
MKLADLFPDGDYRFHLTLRRAEPRDFFAPQDPSRGILAERALWLATEPKRYAALLPEGEPLVAECAEMAAEWTGSRLTSDQGSYESLLQLGRTLEPDLLLLSSDPDGNFRLRAGALCFPTGWALEEKIGQPLDVIHGVVPGLNPALGPQIQQFLSKLKPGVAFLRDNWGISATDELNLHPTRRVPAPSVPVSLERLWLRFEHQALVALPQSRGILFGIRIALHRLDDIAKSDAGPRLRRALETMPSQLAAYKRLDAIRAELVGLLSM